MTPAQHHVHSTHPQFPLFFRKQAILSEDCTVSSIRLYCRTSSGSRLGGGGRLPQHSLLLAGVVSTTVAMPEDDNCSRLCVLITDGPARPLGYHMESPTRGGAAGPGTPSPPWKEGLPAGEGWMRTDTDSAGSVSIDSGPPTAATLGPTNVEEEVAATGATSLGCTSLHSISLGRCALELVK